MKQIKVLGSGCSNCRTTAQRIEEVAQQMGVAIQMEKVERFEDIAAAGILRTPGVIIDGKIVHAGGVPDRAKIEQWLTT